MIETMINLKEKRIEDLKKLIDDLNNVKFTYQAWNALRSEDEDIESFFTCCLSNDKVVEKDFMRVAEKIISDYINSGSIVSKDEPN